ncbi:29549_t:CDS:2, partial [Racocetra persica]
QAICLIVEGSRSRENHLRHRLGDLTKKNSFVTISQKQSKLLIVVVEHTTCLIIESSRSRENHLRYRL